MEILSGPWADLVLLFRQTVLETDRGTDSIFPLWLFGLLMFMSVCVLLLQLIVYFSWKLRQADTELSRYPEDRSAIYRHLRRGTHLRRRRSVG